jgi:hypothetical protein
MLRLWVDASGDGCTDIGELQTLDDYNIARFSLATTAAPGLEIAGNSVPVIGLFTRGEGGEPDRFYKQSASSKSTTGKPFRANLHENSGTAASCTADCRCNNIGAVKKELTEPGSAMSISARADHQTWHHSAPRSQTIVNGGLTRTSEVPQSKRLSYYSTLL